MPADSTVHERTFSEDLAWMVDRRRSSQAMAVLAAMVAMPRAADYMSPRAR